MTQETIDAPTFKALQEAAGAEFVADLVGTFLDDEAPAETVDLICLSGRGDKDLAEALEKL